MSSKTFKNGVTIEGTNITYKGQVIGSYHRINSNYPPSMISNGGKQIGCNNDEDIARVALAAHLNETIGAKIDGNIFPNETWILRINDISLSSNFGPSPVTIVAKVHYNHHNSTGSSTLSKPTKHTIMEIDLDKGSMIGCEKGKDKEFQFVNQKEMIEKLKAHVGEKLSNQLN